MVPGVRFGLKEWLYETWRHCCAAGHAFGIWVAGNGAAMTYSIHFVCRGRENVAVVQHPTYTTGYWGVSEDGADKLIGGMVYLHETKGEPSYFGGRVASWRYATDDDSVEHAGDIIFTIQTNADGKGQPWSGRIHSMAWTSGLVES